MRNRFSGAKGIYRSNGGAQFVETASRQGGSGRIAAVHREGLNGAGARRARSIFLEF